MRSDGTLLTSLKDGRRTTTMENKLWRQLPEHPLVIVVLRRMDPWSIVSRLPTCISKRWRPSSAAEIHYCSSDDEHQVHFRKK